MPVLLSTFAIVVALLLSARHLAGIVPVSLWWQSAFSPDPHDIRQIIAHDSWLPRLVISGVCGAILGLAGTLFQQVLRNPLAEPMTLGVSAGAQLALSVATLWAPTLVGMASQSIALAGAAMAALLVFGLAWRGGLAPVPVAVAGLVVTLYCGSIGVALQLFYAPYLRGLFIWGGGSLVQQDWQGVMVLLPQLLLGGGLSFLLLRPMILFGLDDANVRSLGMSLRRMRLLVLMLAVVLSAAVVSAVGVIGFVGLAAPALARFAGARRLSQRLVVAPLCGALILWVTDQIVQEFSGGLGELIPTGAATALMGAPVMLLLLSRMRQSAMGGTGIMGVSASSRRHAVLRMASSASFRWRTLAVAVFSILMLAVVLDFGRGPQGWHFSSLIELSRVAIWRAPRAVASLAAGVMLAVAGTLMQRLTGNPLASPEVLGVSAGAALGLIVLVIFANSASPLGHMAAAATGAFIALSTILWFAKRSRFAPDRVLLAGISIGALFQAWVAVVIASGGERAVLLLTWLSGSTYTVTPADTILTVTICVILCALVPLCGRWLHILPLGEAPSRALGMETAYSRCVLLGLIALLTAGATLVVGPLSFIGLTAPHFARLLGARRPLQQIAMAAPVGAIIMLLADWLGRVGFMPRELPAGLMATLIAAPYLMWLLGRRR